MKRLASLMLCLSLLSFLQIVAAHEAVQIKSRLVTQSPNFSGEFSHGFINGSYGVDLWYVWLNTSGTHLLFLAMYSSFYPSPINYFIGQHYFTANGTEVFIGNRLLGFEIYEDVNGNLLLDANYTDGFDKASDEARYFFLLNASQNVDLESPSKSTIDNVTHYIWSVKYGQAQGVIEEINYDPSISVSDPETDEWVPSFFTGWVSATLDFLNFTFDYWVENNAAYLKMGSELGTFSVAPRSPGEVVPTFNNSFSALYSTSVLSPKPYEIVKEGVEVVNSTRIDVEEKESFKMIFNESYTLSGDPTPYKTTAGMYPINSLPGDVIWYVRMFTRSAEDIFREYLGKTSPSLSGNVTLSIRRSSLIYRVCYPTWGNRALTHDPLYIAYIGEPNFVNPGGGAPLPQTWLVAAFVFGVVVLLVAIYQHIKVRNYKFNGIRSLPIAIGIADFEV